MPDDTFSELRTQLLDSGVAPKHVRRIVDELNDHYEDLQVEALQEGKSSEQAAEIARQRIGNQSTIADRMLSTSEFRIWVYRYPRIARIYLPIAYALLLPATPVLASIANPWIVVRWGAALMLSAGVTALMFLFMQLAIALN